MDIIQISGFNPNYRKILLTFFRRVYTTGNQQYNSDILLL